MNKLFFRSRICFILLISICFLSADPVMTLGAIDTLSPEIIVNAESGLNSFETLYDYLSVNELVRNNIPDLLPDGQIPALRKAKKTELKGLGLRILVKEMARLREALDSGTEEEVLSGIAETMDIIDQVLYPANSFTIGTFNINRSDLSHWIKKVFFWINQDEFNPHAKGVLTGVIGGYVEHVKAYVKQHDLEQKLDSIRRQTNQESGRYDTLIVLEGLIVSKTSPVLPLELISQAI